MVSTFHNPFLMLWPRSWSLPMPRNNYKLNKKVRAQPSQPLLNQSMRVLCANFYQLNPYIWLVCGYMQIKEQTPSKHMFKRDWTTSWLFVSYSTLENGHKWEDLCIQLRNQQTRSSNNHHEIRGGLIFNMLFLLMPCRKFVNATRF